MKINPAHNDFWFDRSKIVIFYGGKGSGKSWTTCLKILSRVVEEEGHRILCIHKWESKVRNTIYQQFIEILEAQDIKDLFHCVKNPFSITYKANGNTIIFQGLDAEKIGSTAGITSVWIDEAHFITEDDWVNIVGSLGRSKDFRNYFQFVLTFNPFGGRKHWLNKRFILEGLYNAKIYHTVLEDNEFRSDDYESVLDANKNNHSYYQAARFGLYTDVDSNIIFNNWEIYNPVKHKHLSVNLVDYIPKVGLDWGHRNAAVALLVGTRNDNLIVFDEIYRTGLTTPQFINLIVGKKWERDLMYYCDSANPDKILELSNTGYTNAIGVKKGAGSIAYGIDILLRYNIIIMPQCVNLIREIEQYEYGFNAKTSEQSLKPKDNQSDDAVDALRYSMESSMESESTAKAVYALY